MKDSNQSPDAGERYLGSLVAVGAGCGLALGHAGGQRVGEVLQDGRVVGPENK